MEGFWSLLRSWLRPHRGILQEKLPIYLGLFQFTHNARKRGKALLGALVATFGSLESLTVTPDHGMRLYTTLRDAVRRTATFAARIARGATAISAEPKTAGLSSTAMAKYILQ